jgi:hypothetical protein
MAGLSLKMAAMPGEMLPADMVGRGALTSRGAWRTRRTSPARRRRVLEILVLGCEFKNLPNREIHEILEKEMKKVEPQWFTTILTASMSGETITL